MRRDMEKIVGDYQKKTGGDGFRIVRKRIKRLNENDLSHIAGIKVMRSMRDGKGYYYGDFTPLIRFLNSKEGSKWDEVYSDICRQINRNSKIGQFIFQWISYIVETDIIIGRNGVIFDSMGNRIYNWRGTSMYVDQSGILRFLPKERVSCKKDATDIVKITNLMEYRLIKGIWYKVTFNQMLGDGDERSYVWDILDKQRITLYWMKIKYGNRIPKHKVQISKHEIKKARLRLIPGDK